MTSVRSSNQTFEISLYEKFQASILYGPPPNELPTHSKQNELQFQESLKIPNHRGCIISFCLGQFDMESISKQDLEKAFEEINSHLLQKIHFWESDQEANYTICGQKAKEDKRPTTIRDRTIIFNEAIFESQFF